MASNIQKPEIIDYRGGVLPQRVRDIIDEHLAIEAEDAKTAGTLGFMSRALVIATMPYKDPKQDVFYRKNGDFTLRIVAGYQGGIPSGIYPRLILSWVTTEAVRTQSPVIELGDSLRTFLRDVLDLRSTSGGSRGTATRVSEQLKRLFGSLITAEYSGKQGQRGFSLRNVLIATDLDLDTGRFDIFKDANEQKLAADKGVLWTPQNAHEAGAWSSRVQLSTSFFKECVDNPVPINLRAYKALRGSPLAMDIYTWLTYRFSYIQKRGKPIPWHLLMMQFGSGFNISDMDQAVRNFKKQFLLALKLVETVYPGAKVAVTDDGLVLYPSAPHILPNEKQRSQGKLF
jgi:hypothetical protein